MIEQAGFLAPTSLSIDIENKTAPDPLKGGDVYKWAIEQAALIRAGRYKEVDWVNVADEIESVGKSELRALKSNLQILLTHMLKWDYQPKRRGRSWSTSIEVHRMHIDEDLAESGSLRSKIQDAIDRTYRAARTTASGETNLPPKVFPAQCPYDWDTIMTRPFVFDQTDEAP